MFDWFALLRFLHICAVIVWVGGMIALTALNLRLAGKGDGPALGALSRQSRFFGQVVLGPAAGITLITGLILMGMLGGQALVLWMLWGLAVVAGSLALGAVWIRRAQEELERVAVQPPLDAIRLAMARRRVALLSLVNVLLLFSGVWAMVFKPTL